MQLETSLSEIVKLVGIDALSPSDRLIMEGARSIREDFLQQDAMDEDDAYCPLEKQFALLDLILFFYRRGREAIISGADVERITELSVRERIGRAKSIPSEQYREEFAKIKNELSEELDALVSKGT